MTKYAYLWRPPHSYLFPRPYEPEDIKKTADELSPFPLTIDMSKETTKTTAVSVMKNIAWLAEKRESSPLLSSNGDDFFAVERGVRKRELEKREEDMWEDMLLSAVDGLTNLKRARTEGDSPRNSKVYRKTPPLSPSLRKFQASRRLSPCPSSSSPLSSGLQSSGRTSLSEMSALSH